MLTSLQFLGSEKKNFDKKKAKPGRKAKLTDKQKRLIIRKITSGQIDTAVQTKKYCLRIKKWMITIKQSEIV